jgi:hypothetical protein
MARPVRVSTATIQSKTGKKASWSAGRADEQTMRSQGSFQAEEGTAGRGGGAHQSGTKYRWNQCRCWQVLGYQDDLAGLTWKGQECGHCDTWSTMQQACDFGGTHQIAPQLDDSTLGILPLKWSCKPLLALILKYNSCNNIARQAFASLFHLLCYCLRSAAVSACTSAKCVGART